MLAATSAALRGGIYLTQRRKERRNNCGLCGSAWAKVGAEHAKYIYKIAIGSKGAAPCAIRPARGRYPSGSGALSVGLGGAIRRRCLIHLWLSMSYKSESS